MVGRSGTSFTSTKKGRCRRNAAATRTSLPCALPSAGITQVRFEGWLSPLSLSRDTPSGHVSVPGKHTTPRRRRRADRPQARPAMPPPRHSSSLDHVPTSWQSHSEQSERNDRKGGIHLAPPMSLCSGEQEEKASAGGSRLAMERAGFDGGRYLT